MRKVIYGTAIAVSVLVVAILVVRQTEPAKGTVHARANHIVDVRALESTIDVKALPRLTVDYVD
jgi:hypothetical protein